MYSKDDCRGKIVSSTRSNKIRDASPIRDIANPEAKISRSRSLQYYDCLTSDLHM